MTEVEVLPLFVITKNVATGEIEGRKLIDHNSYADRKWLGKHCYWAFRNGRSILTVAEADTIDNRTGKSAFSRGEL